MAEAALKKGWIRVVFGDVVKLSGERSSNPEDDGFERFVGLEHIDPGDLKIRRWGDIADGTTFTSVFRPGQVLFGKRRAYQRKIAVADFSGVCSGDIYILETKSPHLLTELLPFICQTDGFLEHAVGTSAGSLSPRTNWESLARYEFALPPLEEQRQMTSVLQAARDVGDSLADSVRSIKMLRIAVLNHHFSTGSNSAKVKRNCRLDDLLEKVIDYRGRTPPKSPAGVPLLTAKNVRQGFIDPEPREFIDVSDFDSWMRRGLPQRGDVLFTTEAPLGNVARVPEYRFALAQRVVLLRANNSLVDERYLYWLLQAPSARREILARASGSTATGIKQSLLREISVSIPSREEQEAVCRWLDEIEARQFDTQNRLETARNLAHELTGRLLQ